MLELVDILRGYNFFSDRLYKYPPLKITNATNNIGESFNQLLNKKRVNFGNQSLFRYLAFQFHYWSSKEVTSYNGKINLNYIYGPKAFQRWEDRNLDYGFIVEEYLGLYGITLNSFILHLRPNKTAINNSQIGGYQNPSKLLSRRTEDPLLTCITLHLSFSPTDRSCINCPDNKHCNDYYANTRVPR